MAAANDLNCDIPRWDQSGSQNLPGNASIQDSAYVSLARSNGTGASEDSTTDENAHRPRRGSKLPGTNLSVFEKEIDSEAKEWFQVVRGRIQTLLGHKRSDWVKDDPNPAPMTTRLLVLGEIDTETAPYLVVFCAPKLYERVHDVLKSSPVRDLYDPADQSIPRLKVKVIKHAPRMTASLLKIDVCYNRIAAVDQITFCGTPILLVDQSRGTSSVRKRKATLGGVIEVTFEGGKTTHYGMTAGHAVEDVLRNGILHGLESDYTDYSDDDGDMQRQDPFEAWDNSQIARFAGILDNKSLPGVVSGSICPSHDWGLLEIDDPKPNVLSNLTTSENMEPRQLVVATRPAFEDELSDPVIMMGAHGPKKGRLSSLVGSILIGHSETFVETYMLELDEGNEVRDGDSGAWVIHFGAPDVYGHVVAIDPLGDAYVVPIQESFNEIRDRMGAVSVGLPKMDSFIRNGISIAGITNEFATATPYNTHTNGSHASDVSFAPQNGNFTTTNLKIPFDTSRPARINDLSCEILARDRSRSRNGVGNTFVEELDVVSLDHVVLKQKSGIEEKCIPWRGVKFPGKDNLFVFEKTAEEGKCFQEVRQKVERLVVNYIRSTRRYGSNARSITSEILFLGENYEEAAPYLVIFCPSMVHRRVCRFLDSSKRVKELCEPTGQTDSWLKVEASRYLPQTKSAQHEMDIFYDSTTAPRTATLRRTPRLFNHFRRSSRNGNQEPTTAGPVSAAPEDLTPLYSGKLPAQAVKHLENSMSDGYDSASTDLSNNGDGDEEEPAHVSGVTQASSRQRKTPPLIHEHLADVNDTGDTHDSPFFIASEKLKNYPSTDPVGFKDGNTFSSNSTVVANSTDEFAPIPSYKSPTISYHTSSVSILPENGNHRMRSAARSETIGNFRSNVSTSIQAPKSEYINKRRSKTSAIASPPIVNPSVHRHAARRGGSPIDFYAKSWDSVIGTKQDFAENWSSYVECKRNIEAAADGTDLVSQDSEDSTPRPKADIDLFLQDSEDSIPSCKVDEVREFCRGVCLEDLRSGRGTSTQQPGAGAWLDDRTFVSNKNSECARDYQNPLNAAKLYELLKVPRIGSADFPDADRRLIYIAGLDPYFILALAETASFHETLVLRDAIWKHIARQTSLRVRIPSRGISIYQLEFHLPYFALRISRPAEYARLKVTDTRTSSQCTDLSFLRLQTPKSYDSKKYVMLEAHISFVICGSDDHRWVAYGFDDTDFEGEDLDDKICPCEGFRPDPFSSDGEVDADIPIWNPREYFVMILDNRMAQALTEWESLVRAVERSIKEYRERHPSTLSDSSGSARGRDEEIRQAFDWTRKTIELLRRLQEALSSTIKFWERFNDPNGDVGYFIDKNVTDPSQNRIHLSLRAINDTFKTMEDLEITLDHMSGSCRDYAEALQLLLTMEGSEAAKSNGATSDFTLFVLGPIALASFWFQLPRSMLPLSLSPQSFVIMTIAIMVVVKLLHVVSGAIPGFPWWWKTAVALMKTMKLEGLKVSLSLDTCSRLVRRRDRRHHGRNASSNDVEMGTVED